jgi:hypothetical protein
LHKLDLWLIIGPAFKKKYKTTLSKSKTCATISFIDLRAVGAIVQSI